METDIYSTEMALRSGISEIHVTETKTVRALLKELGLLYRHHVVLVDGKRAYLDDEVAEGQRVIVLPIIAGG
ncbi:MAG: MoaD/ThiS family protein [Promethearchaeota archaeon]